MGQRESEPFVLKRIIFRCYLPKPAAKSVQRTGSSIRRAASQTSMTGCGKWALRGSYPVQRKSYPLVTPSISPPSQREPSAASSAERSLCNLAWLVVLLLFPDHTKAAQLTKQDLSQFAREHEHSRHARGGLKAVQLARRRAVRLFFWS